MALLDVAPAPAFRPPAPPPRVAPLGPLGMIRVLRSNPIESWTRLHFERPILTGTSLLGEGAFVADPAAIRRIFLDNADNYAKDDLQRRVLGPGLGKGLLITEGETWKVQRRALAPLFTPKTVASFTDHMASAADVLVARWLKRRDGRPLDVQMEMWRLTLDVLGRTIFSDGLGRDPKEFVTALGRYFETIGRLDIADLLDFPTWVPRINRMRSQPALDFFAEVVDTLVARRRALIVKDPKAAPRDLLTLLIEAQDPQTGGALSEAEVQANIVTFIGAGHETTANALTWSLYLLSHAPDWQERLAAEADSVLSAPSLRVDALVETRAVIEEAMRLYPPVASLSRVALGPDDLAGRRIRKGALVLVAPWVLHRHRRLWDEPDLFDPRRFLPGKREAIDRFAYLPFGAGPRVCIGAAFALQEAMIALAKMMQSFSLKPTPGDVEPVQRITLRPRGGMPLILRRRAA